MYWDSFGISFSLTSLGQWEANWRWRRKDADLYRHFFLNKGKSKLKSYFTEAEEAYIQEADLDSNFQIYYIF